MKSLSLRRRIGRSGLLLTLCVLCSACDAAPKITDLNAKEFVQSSLITTGPLKGAVRLAPGKQVNWYFANLGLYPLANTLPDAVRGHLNAYLRNVVSSQKYGKFYIQDYSPALQAVKPDSHDAYASSFLSLSRAYVEATGDLGWFKTHKAAILDIAYHNLALQAKPNGLIKTFQTPNGGSLWDTGFTMDNAENYQGLGDLVWLLKKTGDPQTANYYTLVQRGVARGLYDPAQGNWNTAANAFFVSDRRDVLGGSFYPDAVVQAWPQLYGVPDATREATQAKYKSAWAYFERYAPSWEIRSYDGPFAWMSLGAAAALAGDQGRAIKQRQYLREQLKLKKTQLYIHDLGFDALIGQLTE